MTQTVQLVFDVNSGLRHAETGEPTSPRVAWWCWGFVLTLALAPASMGQAADRSGDGTGETQSATVQEALARAEGLIESQQLDQALQVADSVLAEFGPQAKGSDPGRAHLIRGEVFYLGGHYIKAAQELNAALHRVGGSGYPPLRAEILVFRGLTALALGDARGAKDLAVADRHYRKVHDTVSQARAQRLLGQLYLTQSRLNEAQTALERAIALGAGNEAGMEYARAALYLGDVLTKQEDFGAAEQWLSHARDAFIERDHPSAVADAEVRLGELMLQQERIEDARAWFSSAKGIFERLDQPLGVANCVQGLGDALGREGHLDEAAEDYEQALGAYEVAESLLGQGNAHRRLGDVRRILGQPSEAEAHYTAAIQAFAEMNLIVREAAATTALAVLLEEQGRAGEAGVWYDRAGDLYQAAGIIEMSARAYTSAGGAYQAGDQLEDARRAYQASYVAWSDFGDSQSAAMVLGALGNVLNQIGDSGEAERVLELAVEGISQQEFALGRALAESDLADALRAQGKTQQALKVYDSAIATFEDLDARELWALAQIGRGNILVDESRYEEAATAYELALAVLVEHLNSQHQSLVAETLVSLGNCYRQLTQYENALLVYGSASKLASSDDDAEVMVDLLNGQGDAYRNIGNYHEAMLYLVLAKQEARELQNDLAMGTTARALGYLQIEAENKDAALDEFGQAWAIGQSLKSAGEQAAALLGMGLAELVLSDDRATWARAEDYLRRSARLANNADDLLMEAHAFTLLGMALDAQGSHRKAIKLCRRADKQYEAMGLAAASKGNPKICIARGLLGLGQPEEAWKIAQSFFDLEREASLPGLGGPTAQRQAAERQAPVTADLVLLAVDLGRPEEALNAALQGQGRGILMSRRTAATYGRLTEDERSPLADVVGERRAAAEGVGAEITAVQRLPSAESWVSLMLSRNEAARSDTELRARLSVQMDAQAPPRVSELQRALAADPRRPVMAIYYQRRTDLLVFVLDGKQVAAHHLAGAGSPGVDMATVKAAGERLAGALQMANMPDSPAGWSNVLGRFPLDDAASLYRWLVGPWESTLECDTEGCRPLLVVPDGMVHQVPFTALAMSRSEPGEAPSTPTDILKAQYLGRRVAIAVLPSAGLLLERLRSPHPPSGAAVLGSPTGSNLGKAEESEVEDAWAALRRHACQDPLTCPPAALVGVEASEGNLMTWLNQARIVHSSGHGTACRAQVSEVGMEIPVSRLRQSEGALEGAVPGDTKGPVELKGELLDDCSLHPVAENASTPDGYVYPDELAFLESSPWLVVLSSCSSALGEETNTEGFVGVTHALLGAGTGNVISAMWPVRVEPTRDLMIAFYDHLLDQGEDPATALLHARQVVKGELFGLPELSFKHPYFWAAFNLYGYEPAAMK